MVWKINKFVVNFVLVKWFIFSLILGRISACPTSCQCDADRLTVSCQPNLTDFPKGIPTNTEKLSILSSNITQIPENALSNLVNLKIFHLQNNKQLRTIPAKLFDKLYNLKVVTISFNNMPSIPAGLFTNLPNLETVLMRANGIINLPDSLFKNLTKLLEIELGHNMISSLPDNLIHGTVTKLELIDLINNQLSSIPDNFFSSTANSLQELLLANNNFREMPVKALKVLKSLSTISIEKNPLLCNCSLKEFADWAKTVSIHGTISCSTGVKFSSLSKINLTHCEIQPSTPAPITLARTTTELSSQTTVITPDTMSPSTTQESTHSTKTSKKTEEPGTQPPDNGDADSQDSDDNSDKRKTLILAISISAVAVVVVVSFVLWLFHTGILSPRCNMKFEKSKVVILDAEGRVLVRDGQIVT